MNILRRYTIKSLMRNPVRTAVTIIGVILSAAMLTAVTVSLSSLLAYLKDVAIYNDGNWHGVFYDMPASESERLIADDRVDSAAIAETIGYASCDAVNAYKPYIFVQGADRLFFERMPVHLTGGRLPENASEIILPEHLMENGVPRPAIGSLLTLDIGDRIYEGEALMQFTPYMYGEDVKDPEELVIRESRTYTVVGYYERPSFENHSAPGFTALTVREPASGRRVDAYFLMKHPDAIYDGILCDEPFGQYGWSTNGDLLMFSGASAYKTFYSVLFSMGAILIFLIMFGSVSLIYNAFSISVADRTKQFGLLSSIGATKKQLRRTVFIEAAAVSLVGIPIGVLSGIAGMGVTFHFIGDRFGSIVAGGGKLPLRLTATWEACIIASVISFVTVLISAWIPSRRATKITAVEAIRQSSDIAVSRRDARTSRLTWKLFGVEGAIASKHFKRNRKGYRATVVSLFMSVVLFISASSFCRYLTDSVSGVFESSDFDITGAWGEAYRDADDRPIELTRVLEALSQLEEVTNSSGAMRFNCDAVLQEADLSDDAREGLAPHTDGSYEFSLNVVGVDDDTFRDYLRKEGLTGVDYFDADDPRAVVKSTVSFFNSAEGRLTRIPILAEGTTAFKCRVRSESRFMELISEENEADSEDWEERYEACFDLVPITVGDIVSDLPFGYNYATNYELIAVYPLSVFESIFTDAELTGEVNFKTTGHKAGFTAIKKAAEDNGLSSIGFTDVYAQSETQMDLVVIIKVFSYGFIALISLIALANVFNTISTNIALRRREFAMLKSVGETSKGFNRMMRFECVLYGVKSLMYGVPAAIGLTYLMFRSVNQGIDIDFYLPWTAVAIAVGSVFLVVFATMMYAMGRVKRDDPIEGLKANT